MPSIVVIKAEIDHFCIRLQHLHHRNWGRAAAGNIAVLLPLLRVHGDIREHINGSLEHIKAPVRAGMMKAVTRVARLDVQAKRFAEAVRAAQMCVAWAVSFVRANEHGIMMRCVLIEQFSAGKVRNNIRVQPARFEKIRKYAVHIRVRNRRCEGLLLSRLLFFCLRIKRLHALAQQHRHGFDVAFAVIFLYKTDRAAALIRGMIEPFTAAHRDAVVAGEPLFPSGLDELFALLEEKFFEVDRRGAFFLVWSKFNKSVDFKSPLSAVAKIFVLGYTGYRKGAHGMQTQVYSIDEIREIVAPIAKQHGVDKVFLFGSYARGDATPASDVDLCVDAPKLRGLFALGGLYADLEDALKKSIDVVTTGSLKYNKDEAFLENLRKDRVLLYELS